MSRRHFQMIDFIDPATVTNNRFAGRQSRKEASMSQPCQLVFIYSNCLKRDGNYRKEIGPGFRIYACFDTRQVKQVMCRAARRTFYKLCHSTLSETWFILFFLSKHLHMSVINERFNRIPGKVCFLEKCKRPNSEDGTSEHCTSVQNWVSQIVLN